MCLHRSQSPEDEFELPTTLPRFESSLLSDGEGRSGDDGSGHGSNEETTLLMELHDTSEVEGRTLHVVISNPMASMSGDLSNSFVSVDLETCGEQSLSVEGASEECEGGVATNKGPSLSQRCLSCFKQGLKNLLLDLKLFFW